MQTETCTAAYGLMKSITDHVFIVAFHVVRHFFGYIKGLSTKLQGSALDVIQGYEMVSSVTEVLKSARVEEGRISVGSATPNQFGGVGLSGPNILGTYMRTA